MAQEGWAVEQEEPMFCTNNCGLLGNPATMNLCSKCYEEARAKQQSYSTSKTLEETVKELSEGKSLEEPLTTQDLPPRRTTPIKPQTHVCACLAKANLPPPPPAAPIRCSSCRKRVGLMGIKCRCGSVFCALHRYSDRHDCPFDYRTSARATIAKANPMVRAEKIRKL